MCIVHSLSTNQNGIMQHYPYDSVMALKHAAGRTNSNGSTEDLLKGQEPSFLGVLLSPRRSLRVVNNEQSSVSNGAKSWPNE